MSADALPPVPDSPDNSAPEDAGSKRGLGLLLKKTALTSVFVLSPHIGQSRGGVMAFTTALVVVPPPLGFVSGVVAAMAFNMGANAGEQILTKARRSMGLPNKRDVEIFREFNRLQDQGVRYNMPRPEEPSFPTFYSRQKTVSPANEMR